MNEQFIIKKKFKKSKKQKGAGQWKKDKKEKKRNLNTVEHSI